MLYPSGRDDDAHTLAPKDAINRRLPGEGDAIRTIIDLDLVKEGNGHSDHDGQDQHVQGVALATAGA
jgi:hypothetical protein